MSNRVAVALLVSLLVLIGSVAAQTRSPATGKPGDELVTITHIANEGFLLAAGERKVLIDALFDRGVTGYPRIPAAIRGLLTSAQRAYAGIDLVLATHFHRDHFDAATVAKHLRANPDAVFVSTHQAVNALRKVDPQLVGVGERVHAKMPHEGERIAVRHGGIGLEILNLHHGRGSDPPTENLGFIVELANRRILHIGDTEANLDDFAVYALAEERIDVALVPYWYLLPGKYGGIVREAIRPRRIVAMHLPTSEAPAFYFSPAKDREDLLARIGAGFPEAVIPEAGERLELDPAPAAVKP